MNTAASQKTNARVDPAWIAARRDDPDVYLVDVAGLGRDDLRAYKAGHAPFVLQRPAE